jgi:hypothetical protein
METKTKTIHERMAIIKHELAKRTIKKSGHNKFAGFKYHELSDFIEHINELNFQHGVNDCIQIDEVQNECRITLTNVNNVEDSYTIITPFREAEMLGKGGAASSVDAVQRMGSTITYNRRYLYMTAYNIQENDGVDGNEQPKTPPPAVKTPAPAPKTITNENFAKGVDKVNKGEMFVPELVKALSGYALTKEQQQIINQLKTVI